MKAGSTFDVELPVRRADHVAIWEFSTKANDIAFVVSFEGEEVVGHTRYRSNEELVQGSFTADRPGTVTLTWDNSYSRMTRKVLKYRALVVDPDAAAAGAAAEEAAKAKIRSRRSVVELLRPRTVNSSVAQVDEGMVARAHRCVRVGGRGCTRLWCGSSVHCLSSCFVSCVVCGLHRDQALHELHEAAEEVRDASKVWGCLLGLRGG